MKNEAENWLSMSEASGHTPYSAEYLSLLARKKKLTSKKIGNAWYTTKPVLDDYMKKQMIRAQVQNGNFQSLEPVHIHHDNFKKYEEQPLTAHKTEKISSNIVVPDIELVLGRVIDKKLGPRFFPLRVVLGSKVLIAAALASALLLALLPVPIVFGFFDKSFEAIKDSINDANTVLGFRPGTHENEILLLDSEGNIAIMGHIETEGQLKSLVQDGIAPIVVDSKTLVKNLNAEFIGGASSTDFTLAFVTANGSMTRENVQLEGSVEVGKTILVRGATKLLSTLEVGGDLKVFGLADFEGIVTTQSDLVVGGNLDIRKNVSIRGGLEVGSAVIAKSGSFGSLGVSNSFSAGGKITLGNPDDVFIINSKNVTLNAAGDAFFDSSVGAPRISATSFDATNSTTTNATSTNLFTNTFTSLLSTITSLIADDITVGALTATNSTTTNSTTTNAVITNATTTNLTVSNNLLTSLTLGSVPFIGTNGLLTQNNTNFFWDDATRRLGIGTNIPDSTLNIVQTTNGVNIFDARRITDSAPSGDFIEYTNAAGDSTLFRVDNSGNLLAGGIITTGSQTITSTSQPQFRVQYDASNEWTSSVGSTGTTTFAFNGTTPRVIFLPASDRTDTFQFQNAAGLAVLSIDTLNQRVGVSTTSPWAKFSVGTHNLSQTLPAFVIASSSDALATTTQFIVVNGNVGIGTTSPNSALAIQGATPAITLANTSLVNQSWQFRNGALGLGSRTFDIFDQTASSTRFAIADDGNTLIGTTTNPGNVARLFVFGGSNGANIDVMGSNSVGSVDQATIELESSSYGTTVDSVYLQYLNHGIGTSMGFANNHLAQLVFSNASTSLIYTSVAKPLIFGTDSIERMRLDSGGNVGIGTTSPYAKLSVVGGTSGTVIAVDSITGFSGNLLDLKVASTTKFSVNQAGDLLSSGSTTLQNFTALNSTSTNATTTNNLFSELFSGNALKIGGLATSTINSSGDLLVMGSTTLQKFSGTNATTTNLFSTTASSSNLYTALFNGAGLATCQTNNVLTWAAGTFGCETDDNTFAWTPTTYGTQNVVATSTGLWLKGSPLGLIASSTFATYSTSTNATTTNLFSTTASSTNLYSSLLTVGGTGLVVDSSRNVGMGTTTPGEKLEIAGGGNLQLSKPLGAANLDIAYVNFNESNIDRDLARITGSSDKTNRAYGRLTFSTMNNGTLSERVRIDEDGFVGIGTTSPIANLHVSNAATMSTVNADASEALFEGANNSGITIAASENARANLYFGFPSDNFLHGILTYGTTVVGVNASDMAIFVNSAEAIRIDSTGNVGIGTTTPWGKLSITQTGTAGDPAFIVEDSASPDSSPFIIDESGKTGIGTAAPLLLLSVADTGTANQAIFGQGKTTGDTTIFVGSAASSNLGGAMTYDNDNNYLALYVNGDRTLNPLVIADGGNVGIGTSSPVAKLTLEGGNFFHRASTSPSVVGFVTNATTLSDMRGGIAIQGNYAYVTNITAADNALAVINISSSTPQIVGSVADAVNMNGADGLAVAGNYAYVTSTTGDSLAVIDISNPTTPKVVGSLISATRLDTPKQIAVSGQYIYITARSDDMVTIVNVSNPTAPVVAGFVSSASLLDFVQGIAVQGKYAYAIGTYSNALAVIDVSRPDTPVIVGSLVDTTNLNNAKNVVVSGRYAYTVATTTSTFTIIDVSNPAVPTIAGTLTDTTKLGQINNTGIPVGLAVAGNYAYVGGETGDYLNVIDISNPSRPYFVTSDTDATRFDGINGILISGNRAYITSRIDDMFTVVNINGTETPALYAGALRGGTAYIDDSAYVGNSLSVFGGINAGLGGIYSNGGIFANVASTTATLPISGLFMGGSVGVGTTSPSAKLSITGTGASLGRAFAIADSGNIEKFVVLDNGNASLGGAPNLHGYGNSGGLLTIQNISTDTTLNGVLELANRTDGDEQAIGDLAFSASSQTGATSIRTALIRGLLSGTTANNRGSVLTFYTRADGGSNDIAERMRISSTGNIGIASTSPWGLLSVNPNGISGPSFVVGSSTATHFIVTNGGEVGIGTTSPYGLLSVEQGTETTSLWVGNTGSSTPSFMVRGVNGNGNVGIGTVAPNSKLEISSTKNNNNIRLTSTTNDASWAATDTYGRVEFFSSDTNTGGPAVVASMNAIADGSALSFGNRVGLAFSTYNGDGEAALTERMRISKAGNVGIGTAAPSSLLSISNNLNTTANTPLLTIASTTGGTSTSTLMTILASGNVGIGTSTPTWLLNPTSASASQLALSAGAGFSQWAFRNAGSNLYFATTTVAGTATTSTSALTIIGSSGSVGIGTTSPSTMLHISGGPSNSGAGGDPYLLTIEDDVGTGLAFKTPDGTTQDINFSNVADTLNARVRWNQSNETFSLGTFTVGGALVFYYDNESEGMRIASTTGNVGIGDTSPTEAKLVVGGDLHIETLSNLGSTGRVLCADASGASVVFVNSTSAENCTVSSERFKHDITDINLGLDTIRELHPVSFIFNGTNEESLGFIAEEVDLIDRRLVAYDDENRPHTVNYSLISAVLTKAVQELDERINGIFDATLARLSDWGVTITQNFTRVGNLFAGTLHIENQLCVDDVCISKEQLKTLLIQAGGQVYALSEPPVTGTTTPEVLPAEGGENEIVEPAATTSEETIIEEPITEELPAEESVSEEPAPAPELTPETMTADGGIPQDAVAPEATPDLTSSPQVAPAPTSEPAPAP